MDIVAFGTLLRRYRRAAGLSQEELAARAQVSERTIRDLERGVTRVPRRDTVALLADALGLAPRERAALDAAQADRSTPTPVMAAPAEPPFVGRTHELALVERHLAGEGPPLLVLAGEPGIGKTRLLHAALPRALAQGLRVLEGGCQRRGGQEPYAPLLGALQSYLRRRQPSQLRTDLQGCAWLVRLLPELAESPIPPLPAWTLTPEQERRLMGEAVGRFLANVAGPAGTLLLLDDLQWAGPDALDLLTMLAHAAGEIPLRVLAAYRDTEAPPQTPLAGILTDLAHAGLAARRWLGPLTSIEAAHLVGELLAGQDTVTAGQRERVLERAGGVPFYVVSCAQALRTAAPEANSHGPETVPWGVEQSIRQRVMALPATGQELLGVAAVIGRAVPRRLLATVLARADDEVLAALDAVCTARLMHEAGAEAYQFMHDVIREVVETDLGAARRAALHRRVAEALEREPGAVPVESLAYHYARSEDRVKAVTYLERAGDKARAQLAHAAAADYYRALVACLDELGQLLEAAAAREKLGQVLATMAHYDAALEAYGCAAETFRAAGDLERLARVSAAMGYVYSSQTKPQEGLCLLQPLLAKLEEKGHEHGLAVLYATMARLYCDVGQYAAAVDAGERAATLARTVGDDRLWATAAAWRSVALRNLGRVEEAFRVVQEVVPLAEAAGDLRTLCFALVQISCQYEDSGDLETSRHYGDRATAVAERSGDPVLRAIMTTRRGMTALYLGDWRRARALDRQVGLSEVSGSCLHDLGRLELAEGDWAAATHCLEQSLAIAESSADPWGVREVQRSLAERDLLMGQASAAQARLRPLLAQAGADEWEVPPLLVRLAWSQVELGDLSAAETTVAQAITRAQIMTYRVALVDALRVQALVFTQQRRWDEATRSLEEGLTLARGMPYPYAEGRLLHVFGQLQAALGEPKLARAHWEAALAIFQRLGARMDIARTEQMLNTLRDAPASTVS